MTISNLQIEIATLFTQKGLAAYLPAPSSRTEQIAHDWLLQDGKRLRPMLTLATYQTLATAPLPRGADRVALAIELLHKASLAHDDIEDGDLERYGKPTLHAAHGVPIALNIGDFLIGEGYRMLAEGGQPPDIRAALVAVAAAGQRKLTIGQGMELEFTARRHAQPTLADYLRVAEYKTGSAFSVALLLGATLAQATVATKELLERFSTHLGIAYQISDDLADLPTDSDTAGVPRMPTLIEASGVIPQARELAHQHRDQALALLPDLPSASLRTVLSSIAQFAH